MQAAKVKISKQPPTGDAAGVRESPGKFQSLINVVGNCGRILRVKGEDQAIEVDR